MDSRLQAIAQKHAGAMIDRFGIERGIGQGALVSMAPTGAVRALVGGRDYGRSQYNRAIQALRQPGSAFKLFVYLAGIENGMMPDHHLIDRPLRIGSWRPRNYDNKYRGKVTLREAMARSINTVAVQITEKVGRKNEIEVARRLGVTSTMRSHPSLALGASEVSLLELTAAYGVITSGGYSVWPHAIAEIRDRDGHILYRRTTSASIQVIKSDVVEHVHDLLQAVVSQGTGRAANPGWPVAGKTGTSQEFRDAWFVGYSKELVTGIWMGNDNNNPMKLVTGGAQPARLWRQFMRDTVDKTPPS